MLRAEGTALFFLSVYLYSMLHGSWWLFALLFLTPDIGILGYFFGPKVGGIVYNSFHTKVGPAFVAIYGIGMHETLFLQL